MLLTLTVWQKKGNGYPTKASEERLDDPRVEAFGAAVERLVEAVEQSWEPFQIVARVGDSSRAVQLLPGWSGEQVAVELWDAYRALDGVVG